LAGDSETNRNLLTASNSVTSGKSGANCIVVGRHCCCTDRALNDDGDRCFAEAFCDLEGEVCDLERMGDIARGLIMECAAREDSLRQLELAVFAVWQLAKMTEEFKENYYKRTTASRWACHEASAPSG
jgi:hypothetical protein